MPPVRIAVIAEADADRRLICDLIDRKLRHHAPDWLDPNHLDDYREWCGLEAGEEFTPWKALKHLKDLEYRQALRAPGPLGFSGSMARANYDGASARKALVLAALLNPRPQVVVLVRDMDQQVAERRASIEAERDRVADTGALAVVLALPNAKREAWVLNGFDARNRSEKAVVAALKAELGFHPCERAEQLTTTSGHPRDAKRVLHALTNGNRERETACWEKTDWSLLRERGAHTGLQAFLAEIQSRLLPVVIGPPPGKG